jgi:hypothetical protein
MTMKKGKSVAASLATATCSLLGNTATEPVQAQEEPGWDFNTALLYYGEGDSRVQDFSLNLLARRTFVDDRSLSLGFAFDSLTGATPVGAIPFDSPQTLTRASGRSVYSVPAGEIPLDDTFLDTRYAISANWEQPLGRLYSINAGVSASFEYDYTHIGANFKLSRDFNNRNTTASIGLAFGKDDMDPEGGAPVPLAAMLDVGDQSNKAGDESKDIVDVVFGLTQVINRNMLLQLSYSFSDSSGYLNDPYKILSLVDAVTGDPVPRVPAPGTEGPLHEYRFESRPDGRTKHSFYAQTKYYMDGKVLDASYRFMTDDWGIDSHTADLRYRWPIGEASYLEPHLRFYSQSEADFYRISLVDGVPLPSYASADYRLGDFDALTVGLKYGWTLASGNEMSARIQFYQQDGDAPQNQLIGNQLSRDMYPDLDAIIAQFSYRFGR